MFDNMNNIESRITNLERNKGNGNSAEGIEIYLNFNSNGENDPNEIFFLCKVPPKSQWRTR